MRSRQRCLFALSASLLGSQATAAPRETVEVFSAGSLRAVVTDVAQDLSAWGIDIKPTFGGSGLMRERIEKGEKPDLLLSADVGSPRKLEAQGRTVVPVIPFARNRMCIVSPRSMGLSASNLIDHMLEQNVRLKTSTPLVDPAGDYAWAIFDRIEAQHPGSAERLKAKAQASMSLDAKDADVRITYCSAVPTLEKERPELASLVVSGALDPHPIDGMAVLSSREAAWRVALYLLSDKGQAIIAREGLVPLAETAPAAP